MTFFIFQVPQSCQDFFDLGVTESGKYSIDPDGSGVGLPPYEVFCNFETGK